MSGDGGDPAALRQLFEQGFTVFERAYSDAEVDFFRDHLTRVYEQLGRPRLSANPPYYPAPDVQIGPAGVVFQKLTAHYPDMAPRLYKRRILETIRGLLGRDMHLELPAAALSDASRPFFDWHIHIDGVDDESLGYKRIYRTFERSERVTALLYLDDLTDDNGKLLVYPRKLVDPTAPPYDVRRETWPGQVEIGCPRGSMVVLEQCTWHAARPKRTPGVRGFVASYFAASYAATTTPLADPSLRDWKGDDELFRSVIPRS